MSGTILGTMNGREKLTQILPYGQLSDGEIQKPNINTDKYKITHWNKYAAFNAKNVYLSLKR